MPSQNDSFTRLNEVAEAQQGYFTAKQAVEAGYADNTHPYHVRIGHWIRHCRGIYRLAHYPPPEDGEMLGWYLWSRNRAQVPQGAYSHETALSIHELSDVMPAKLHLTVPPGFRRSSPIPKVLVLHRGSLDEKDAQAIRGFRVTRPFPTILTLVRDGTLAQDLVKQALAEGRRRGLILVKELRQATVDSSLPAWFSTLAKKSNA